MGNNGNQSTQDLPPQTGNLLVDCSVLLAFSAFEMQNEIEDGKMPSKEKLMSYLSLVITFLSDFKNHEILNDPTLQGKLDKVGIWAKNKAEQLRTN